MDVDNMTAEQRAEAWEAHKKRQERFRELNKMRKADLCRLYRQKGHVWSAHPLEQWRKDEIITGIIDLDQEMRRA